LSYPYVQSVVGSIDFGDGVICILGGKATLDQAIAGPAVGSVSVRSLERNWRPGREPKP